MIRIEQSVVLQAPVDQVFRYAADHQKWSEGYEGVSNVKTTTGAAESNKVRYAYTVRVMGFPAEVETDIHDFSQNRGWTGIATKGLPHSTTWISEPFGTGTRLTRVVEGHVPVPLVGSLLDSLFLRPQWDKIVKTSLENPKQRLLA
jgi:hypothetical protein